MSTVNNGPQIVRSGLVLDLDASSVTSYSAIAVYSVQCYSTYNGGLRSANYTVQYSDDNSTWTTAFTGVMSNNSSCGIIIGTNRNDSNYSKHRYWRYVEGAAVAGHHPRVARIDFITKSGAVYNLITSTTDNCSDSGVYIIGTQTKDFGGTTWRDTSGNSNNVSLTNGPTYNVNNKGNILFDGVDDYGSITNASSLRPMTELTIELVIKAVTTTAGWNHIFGINPYTSLSPLIFLETGGQLIRALHFVDGVEYRCNTNETISTSVFKHVVFTFKPGDAIRSYFNGVASTTASIPNGTLSYNTSNAFLIGYLGANWPNVQFGLVRMYNKALTQAEVSQNFQATRTRFGL